MFPADSFADPVGVGERKKLRHRSTTSPIIPYGGFSPVRLEGWLFK